jgi:hypothetical protein
VEIVEQQCYDVDGLDDVPLVLKILGLEHHQAEIFDVNPNMSVSVECGMYAHPPACCAITRVHRPVANAAHALYARTHTQILWPDAAGHLPNGAHSQDDRVV